MPAMHFLCYFLCIPIEASHPLIMSLFTAVMHGCSPSQDFQHAPSTHIVGGCMETQLLHESFMLVVA
jgi:hypothetical protein